LRDTAAAEPVEHAWIVERAAEEVAVNIEFLSTVAVVAPDPPASRKLYVDALGLPLKSGGHGEYHHSEQIAGCKSFGIWPLSQAAEACFGTPEWPAERPVPHRQHRVRRRGRSGGRTGG
jgi:catechol 2,3-dioxygenase-like lactoylglutathione lyase family enzyme